MKRRAKQDPQLVDNIKVEKLVHGGQGIATLPDGRKVFLWNALPGEVVDGEITTNKKSFAEGVAVEIKESCDKRQGTRDPDSYLSTSPWQIMDIEYENQQKWLILREAMEREGVGLKFKVPSSINQGVKVEHVGEEYFYRNKMEYSFWADENGLSLALFNRGTHRKITVTGSSIARPEIDQAAQAVLAELNQHKVEGRELKTILLRCQTDGGVIARVYSKNPELKSDYLAKLVGSNNILGISVVYSNPLSPASVTTKILAAYGKDLLADKLFDKDFHYAVDGFWQVKLDIYEQALSKIKEYLANSKMIVDFYSGVGSIGISVASPGSELVLVEVDPAAKESANANLETLKKDGVRGRFILSKSEDASEQIVPGADVILDPPRAGIDQDLVDKLLEIMPNKLVYLSCNPSTQARDLKRLESGFEIVELVGYNFFPHTPHIESLALLRARA